ncbi:MAG: pyridoxal-phosphate dependent enzyme [Ginsengibacter sp.]
MPDSISIQPVKSDLFSAHFVTVDMLRLDEIHPVVSGNKIFKLHYFLEEAQKSLHKQIVTFGGAYSNHLAATAFACKTIGIKCIGYVRGEQPAILSHTLQFCLKNKMHLEFISRSDYKKIDTQEFSEELIKKHGEHVLIPEGGFSKKGAKGATLIYNFFDQKNYTHICCPVGTATTFAGIIDGSDKTKIIGFSVLKDLLDINKRIAFFNISSAKNYAFIEDYHFGGYAKKNSELISFMNSFYDNNKIPLDFVYTAKMMFGVFDLINKYYFAAGSKILCLHTGGLQGNLSLSSGVLNF